ncbi:hypothetical protein ACIPJG_32170 [Streptomyces halstedii]|uniref:hypothetical protein n=1 Tax=Streptomyces halstedii TaxID=1944 RepID=UPI00380F546E
MEPLATPMGFLVRSTKKDQQRYAEEAQRLAELAAYIAANLPDKGRVSGDIERLIEGATTLLRRAAAIETNLEAIKLMGFEESE